MSARELVTSLRRQGVHLWRDGERLRYKAAKGVLTPHVLDQLRHHKSEIIQTLNGPQPLSFAQERLWFLHQLDDEPGSAYNVAAALRLRGALDVAALERALSAIVSRHEVLRARFFADGEHALQQSVPPTPVRLTIEHIHEHELSARVTHEADHHFNLGTAPLVRFSLLRIAPDHHVLVTVLHHMVTDGWSMGVMFRELSTLYRGDSLNDLPIQYADFAAHQRETLTDAALATDIEFWTAHLSGAPPVIELATDYPRPATQSYRGDVVRFQFDARSLKELAQQCDASVFMVLLAGLAMLLHRYSGQEDIVIGTPVANRDRREIEELIGVFSNYIPLRIDLSGSPSFREVIARVRSICLAAYEHQHVPFEKLVEALKPERTLGASPLFQVALVLQNLPSSPLTLSGLDVEQLEIDRSTAKLDLSFLLEETEEGIRGELEYCVDLFTRATAEQMARQYQRVLREEPLLTAPAAWSGAARIENIDSTLRDAFAEQVARTPDAIALVAGEERLTYRELHARACELAERLDVEPEERVAICLPRSADLIVAILGVLEAGAAYVPIDPAHPSDRKTAIIERAGARIVIDATVGTPASRRLMWQRPALPPSRLTATGAAAPDAAGISRRGRRRSTSDNLAYVIYTSGSTGVPKGVMVPHRSACSLVNALANAVYRHHDRPLNVALVAATIFDASVQQIFGALLLGHTLHIVPDEEKRDGASLLAFIRRHQIALTDCTPSLLALMVEAGLSEQPSTLRHILVGGEALPRELAQRIPNIRITNVYGPTECGVDNTAFTISDNASHHASIPIGAPLTNSRVYVLDQSLTPAPLGVPADIWIAGPCLARGYLGDPAQTAAAYRPDPFVAGERMYLSGDRGRWLPTGDLEFLGRSDQQVKIRGYRIELAEIEATLRACDAIRDATVIVEHDQLVAYIVPAATLPTVAELRDHLANHLPPYMIPASFRTLPHLPLNASGKIDRSALRAISVELQQGIGYITPRDDRERALAAVWSSLLGRDRVGANDHFFALGGDSIKALQVVARLRQQGLKLDIRDLFLHSTLSELAPHLKPIAERATPAAEGGEAPLGPAQVWFLNEYPGARHHFHQALVLEPTRPLDVAAFNVALEKVWRHHEALRMRFVQRDGRWLQYSTLDGEPPRLRINEDATRLQASTDLANGPLLLAALYRSDDGERLLLAAHHLVVDGVSWRILLEDLAAAYSERELTPTTNSFRDWAAALPSFDDDIAHWQSVDRECGDIRVDHPDALQSQRTRAEHTIEFSREHTHALLTDAHATYSTRIDDLLLTALARALAPIAIAPRTRILLESHGRQPLNDTIDVSRTVGWFTARYPVVLETTTTNIGRHIKLTKETLRAVPHHGITYRARVATTPQVAFNYLGQLGDDFASEHWRWTREPAGNSIDENASLLHEIEVIGFVAEGRLRLSLVYGDERFDGQTITAFGKRLRTQLAAVIDHARHSDDRALTPSDIDYEGFDIDALDQFLETL
jgi:amino acid adenylation domain-containing protein/non-ribosomal peptide synthase protein (TIGR01720 family)